MDISELIVSSLPLLESFNYNGYPPAFADFEQAAAPFFDSLTPDVAEARAAALVRELDDGMTDLGRREARALADGEKQVLALFLAPAALRRGEAGEAFAGHLSRIWNAAHRRSRFYPGTYDAIMQGFDAMVLGFRLRKPK